MNIVKLIEGQPVQFLAKYILRWLPEMGTPEAGFNPVSLEEYLDGKCAVCQCKISNSDDDKLCCKCLQAEILQHKWGSCSCDRLDSAG